MPPSDTDQSQNDWRAMLVNLQMELISRGGCTDSIAGIRTMLEWSESERMRYKQQYEELLTQFHDFGPKVAEAKKVMQELLAGKEDEVQKLTTELEDRRQLAKDAIEAMKQAKIVISRLTQEAMDYKDEAEDYKHILEMRTEMASD